MTHHPANPPHRLEDAASFGQLIQVACNHCHRKVFFRPDDLIPIFGRNQPVFDLPMRCDQCGLKRYIYIRVRLPDRHDYGKLVIRRPAGIRKVMVWREEVLR